MHIIFNHGQESGPYGTKINRMIEVAEARGHDCQSIDYRDLRDEPDARVERLIANLEGIREPVVLVGSSMGGYVAAVAAARRKVDGLFLIAPALYVGGPYTVTGHAPNTPLIHVLHGWHDDIIPWQASANFAQECGAMLHLVDDEHSVSADLDALASLFAMFLDKVESGSACFGE